MESRRKRYCPKCNQRIRHSARRCYTCGKVLPLWWDYFLLTCLGIVSTVLLLKF